MTKTNRKIESILIFLNILFLTLFFPLTVQALQSHEASYQITLNKAKKKTNIIDVKGKSIYRLQSQCYGWETKEDFSIVFFFNNGDFTKIENIFETFETYDGKSFQFYLYEKVDDIESDNFYGFSNLFDQNQKSELTFISDKEKRVNISNTVNFPITHLKNLINEAKQNNKIYQSEIFLGSELNVGEKIITAIIGLPKKSKKIFKNLNLIEENYWPVNLAYFNPTSDKNEPEFNIYADLQQNGLITEFRIDYDEFSIRLDLKNVREIPIKNCN